MKKILIALMVVAVGAGLFFCAKEVAGYIFYYNAAVEIGKLRTVSFEGEETVVREKELSRLPAPLADYLRAAGVSGKRKIKFAEFKETGFIRSEAKSKWMPFTADQYFSGNVPGFIWRANASLGPVSVSVRDIYLKGFGNMLVKPFALFALADTKGIETNQSALGRCFGEWTLLPTAFLNKNIKWETAGAKAVKGTITDSGMKVSAIFKFNEKNECCEFIADRFAYENGKYIARTFIGRSSEFFEVGGIKIPRSLSGSWILDSGEFEYVKIRIEEGKFD